MEIGVVQTASKPINGSSLLWRGVLDTTPILPGILPFGMIYGAAAVSLGMSPGQAQGMSLAFFAGASQVAATELMARGAGWLTVLVAILVINSRFVMYAAALGQVMPRIPGVRGALASYLLTDQAFAVTLARHRLGRPRSELAPYYFGSSLALWTTWQVGTAAGIVLGSVVPPAWQLEFSIPLMFLALLVPALKDRSSLLAALAAGATVLLGRELPHNLGLILGVFVGIAAGLVSEPRKEES